MQSKTIQLVVQQFSSWTAFFTIAFTIFIVFVTLTSWIHSIFDFPLLPYFENTLADFRHFTHLVFDNLFYRWFSYFLGNLVYYGMVLLKPIINWIPFVPDFTIPSWVRDAAIISIVLLRSQKRAMRDSNPLSTLEMSKIERSEWNAAIQSTSVPLKVFIRFSWKLVLLIYFVTNAFRMPFNIFGLKKLSKFIGLFVGGALMLGLSYFIHDLAITYATRDVDSQYAYAHRAFMKITMTILGVALLASTMFFIVNGYTVVAQ